MFDGTIKSSKKFLLAICAASSSVTINFKLLDIKLENSEAYLPKLEKNLSYGFEISEICCKNEVLNIRRYLKRK